MVLVERALALEAGRHRRLEQLRELAQLRPGLGVVDALPGVDHGPLRVGEHAGRLADTAGSGAERTRAATAGTRATADLLVHDVPRDLHGTGRGRPLRACVNARRIACRRVGARFTCSIHLVIDW